MPIKREKRRRYPASWERLRMIVRARAGEVRDGAGRILVPCRCEGTAFTPDCGAVNGEPHPVTGTRVIIQIAHLCHDESCERVPHLKALCQRCHLRYDRQHHAETAEKTRIKKRREAARRQTAERQIKIVQRTWSGKGKEQPPKPCSNCGKPYKPLRWGRCNVCAEYYRRNKFDRKL